MLHVLYLVHDLADPAVRRRVLMLQAGGAASRWPASGVATTRWRRRRAGADRTRRNARWQIRAAARGRRQCRVVAGRQAARRSRPDVIIAPQSRNAGACKPREHACFGGDVPIVYECLDIHRLLLRKDCVGKALRAAERRLGRNVACSSPVRRPSSRIISGRLRQIECPITASGKQGAGRSATRPADDRLGRGRRQPGTPWKIGWFGALRCRKSLELLAAFSRAMEGTFEIVLRGRPAYSEFDRFRWLRGSRAVHAFTAPTATPRTSPPSTARCISPGRSTSSRKG